MRTLLSLVLLSSIIWLPAAQAAEPLVEATKNNVHVEISLERGAGSDATLVGVFTPDARDLHIYDIALSDDADGGVATRLALAPGSPAAARGPLTADRTSHQLAGLPVYPEGPVTVRLPITLPTADRAGSVTTAVLVSYMACTKTNCRIPVISERLSIVLPVVAGAAPPASTTASATAAVVAPERADLASIRAIVREELARGETDRGSIRWVRPKTVAEAGAAIAEAHAAGKAALLDFTGPSCVNCQKMEKTVFRVPSVVKAFASVAPIAIDTDPPHDDLANWQQERFQSQNRPLYVRIEAGAPEMRWSEVFSPDDTATLARFHEFLAGGTGSDAGTGGGAGFWLLAVFGGLITLLMPCTYPMIPFTLNFFAKQAATGRSVLPLAAFYAAGIVLCFVGLGVLITGIFGQSLSTIAGHPITNLVIALLFVVLGLSLLGAFLLRLPGNIESKVGGGKAGYVGALVMGLTFAITAFSCAAPFAGTVLAEAVASGKWIRAVEGMAVYGGTIAIPFFVLAMSPSVLQRLPRAGAWMNEFKVVGGLVELAAALKFLAICDYAWGWGIIGRSFTLASWSACALVIAIYLLGLIRWPGDRAIDQMSTGRVLVSLSFLVLALWMGSGLCGNNLGTIESFFPGDPAP